jgi:hypothetical protein
MQPALPPEVVIVELTEAGVSVFLVVAFMFSILKLW